MFGVFFSFFLLLSSLLLVLGMEGGWRVKLYSIGTFYTCKVNTYHLLHFLKHFLCVFKRFLYYFFTLHILFSKLFLCSILLLFSGQVQVETSFPPIFQFWGKILYFKLWSRLTWGESNSSGFYHFCVQQFMQIHKYFYALLSYSRSFAFSFYL